MSEEGTNPQPEKGGKMFEHLKGARSRDPEVQEASPVEQDKAEGESTKQGAEEPKKEPADKAGDGGEGLRMKQEIAKLQRQLNQMNPWAQLGMAVGREDQTAIDRWQKGGKIFGGGVRAEEHLRESAEEGSAPAGVSLQEINQLLDQRDAAREQIRRLNETARENLEHFDKISKSHLYVQFLDNNIRAVWNGYMDLDPDTYGWSDEQLAKNYTAAKAAYRQVLADNPKVVSAAKKAGEMEAKERAEAALAGEGSSGSGKSSSQEESTPKTPEQDLLDRMVNARSGSGRPFRDIGRR